MNSSKRFLIVFLAFAGAGACALPGCGNFDFKESRRPNGKYDLSKLIGELKKKKPEPLNEMSWIPLIHLEMTGFVNVPDPSNPGENPSWKPEPLLLDSNGYPPGYCLSESSCYGPLFAYISSRESFYDTKGEGYEVREIRMLLWHLWQRTRSVVKTPYGTREEKRDDFLFGLLGGSPNVRYSLKEKEASGPNA